MRKTAAFLLLLGHALAATVNFDINVHNSVESPDGFPRSSIVAGQFGGVPIVLNKGDFVNINVTNTLTDPTMRRSTSIHWHGLFQDRTASEDGPSFVNQCPIAPNNSYVYSFSTGNQSGTYWYHSHLSTQYADGERGTFVIYDPEDPLRDLYDVDDAGTIITLADWYHTPAEQLMNQFKQDDVTPVPASGLFNGVGRFIGGPAIPWAVVTVEQGKRYRFRVIDISAFSAYTVSVDQHLMSIIEIDGIETVPLTVTSFEIHAAQRYSFVLNATQPVGNYWFRAPMTVAGSNPILDKENVKGILRYVGAPVQDPTSSAVVVHPLAKGGVANAAPAPLEEYQLQTLIDPGAPGGSAPADHVIDLQFDEAGKGTWEINGISYVPPDLPTLLKIINGATVESDFNVSEHTFVLKNQEVVELRIHGADHGITHPFHLHGHAFDIVQSASGPVNFVNPPRRDVIAVDQGGVVIRFRADNPGPWFLHCHIDWHLEAGLAVVFAESPPEEREGPQSQIIKQEWLDLCPAYDALPPEFQ
ncbi:Laccase 17 [Mycena indigotica]|uniref:Laccase 17 n=1 Tax=Mycena indigotica TaxID=2126181 RepID=A0A8H6SJX3_9AGAR|nr:Laccase 17 [Mycena indigotica]KAF7300988.1 Laccase 17 [Mycena indigotica]